MHSQPASICGFVVLAKLESADTLVDGYIRRVPDLHAYAVGIG